MKYLKSLAFLLLAFVLGIVGLNLVFSDFGPGESWGLRILIAVSFFVVSGAVIGFFYPTGWIISALTAWGGVVLGGLITVAAISRYGASAFSATEPPYLYSGLIFLVLPISLALIGGYTGSVFRQRRMNATGRRHA